MTPRRWWERDKPSKGDTFPISPLTALDSAFAIAQNEPQLASNVASSCQLQPLVMKDPRAYVNAPRDPHLIWNGFGQTSLFQSLGHESGRSRCELGELMATGNMPNGWLHNFVLTPTFVALGVVVVLLPLPFIVRFRRAPYAPSRRHHWLSKSLWVTLMFCLLFMAVTLPLVYNSVIDLWSPACQISKTIYNFFYGTFTESSGPGYSWDVNAAASVPSVRPEGTMTSFSGIAEINPFLSMISESFADLQQRDIIFTSTRAALMLMWSPVYYTDHALRTKLFVPPNPVGYTADELHNGICLYHRLAGQIVSEKLWSFDNVLGKHLALVNTLISQERMPQPMHHLIKALVMQGATYVRYLYQYAEELIEYVDRIHDSVLKVLRIMYGSTPARHQSGVSLIQVLNALNTIILPSILLLMILLTSFYRLLKHQHQWGKSPEEEGQEEAPRDPEGNAEGLALADPFAVGPPTHLPPDDLFLPRPPRRAPTPIHPRTRGRSPSFCLGHCLGTSPRPRRGSSPMGRRPRWKMVIFFPMVLILGAMITLSVASGLITESLGSNCQLVMNDFIRDPKSYSQYGYLNNFISSLMGTGHIRNDVNPYEACLYRNSSAGLLFDNFVEWTQWNEIFVKIHDLLNKSGEIFGQDLFMVFGLKPEYEKRFVEAVEGLVTEDWGLVVPDTTSGLFLADGPIVWASTEKKDIDELQDVAVKQIIAQLGPIYTEVRGTARVKIGSGTRTGAGVGASVRAAADEGGETRAPAPASTAVWDRPGSAPPPVAEPDSASSVLSAPVRALGEYTTDASAKFPSLSDDRGIWWSSANEFRFYGPAETTEYVRSLIPPGCWNQYAEHVCVEWDSLCVSYLISKSTYPISIGHKTLPNIPAAIFKDEETFFEHTALFTEIGHNVTDSNLKDLLFCIDRETPHMSRSRRIELANTLFLAIRKSIILTDAPLKRSLSNYLVSNEQETIELCLLGQACNLWHIQSGVYTNIHPRSVYLRKLKSSLQAAVAMNNQDVSKIFLQAYISANSPIRLWKSVDAFQNTLDCRVIRDFIVDLHGSFCNRLGPSLMMLSVLWLVCVFLILVAVIALFC